MGCSSSKPLKLPTNPIAELQFMELQQERCQRERKKEQEQIRKLRKKLAKKHKKKGKTSKNNSEFPANENGDDDNDPTSSSSATAKNKQEEHNLQIEHRIQTQLESDLCAFVLDQAAFTTEYFGNYENEITSTLAKFMHKENECNNKLEEHSVLLTNPLDAAVAKWVRFKPIHGPDKFQSQLLQSPVIYVVFENIDVSRPNDANYDSITPLCKVTMETDSYRTTPCKEDFIEILREIKWKGYVRLRLREANKAQVPTEIGETTKSNKRNSHTYGTKMTSTASSGYGSEGDYDYVYITLLNTHQPLAKLQMTKQPKGSRLDTKTLPDSCASRLSNYIDVSILEENDDDEDEITDDDASDAGNRNGRKSKAFRDYETVQAIRRFKLEQERRRKLLQQRYLNSKEFMCYFGELLRQKLSKHLPISEDDLETATYRSASVFTKDYELIPAIHVAQNAQSWPECALQFRLRERPVNTHPQTGEQVQWPTNAMMKQIESFGYHVIPLGHAPKKRRNPFRELEWRIVFPKAERYLESHLSNTQVKVLMMMKALVKTFLEPVEKDKALLFAIDHIRTHLFWECERDYTAWPEEFLGDVLVRFIESFLYRLRHKRLRDYFIEERNLFESIPEFSLLTLYTTFSDIVGNPLMHLMVAFRNLEYSEKFFPKLNFKDIFFTLAYENIAHLKQFSKNAHVLPEKESDESELDLPVDEDPVGLVGRGKQKERTTGKLRRRTCQLKLEIEKTKQELQARRLSEESIDVEFLFSNDIRSVYNEQINQGVESLRRTNLLEMLLDHYVAMIRKAVKFGNIELAQTWLRQSKRLNKFYNDLGCDMYAKDYESSIVAIVSHLEVDKDHGEFFEEETLTFPKAVSESVQKRKNNKSNDNNAYEDVVPMDDILPVSRNSKQTWEKKLQKRGRSRESSPESLKSMSLKKVVAEVYATKESLHEMKSGKLNSKKSESTAEKTTTSDTTGNKKSANNEKKSGGYSPIDIFREAREEKKKAEMDMKLKTAIEDINSKEINSPASKKSVKFKTPKAGKIVTTKTDSQKQEEVSKGHVNNAYDDSSDEFQTDTESESSMNSTAVYTETEKSYKETSFTKNIPSKSQKTIKEERVSAGLDKNQIKQKTKNKNKRYSSSGSDSERDSSEIRKTKNNEKKSKNGGTEVIQMETQSSESSSDSSSDEGTQRFSFKCLESISIKAILESKEYQEEDEDDEPILGPRKSILDISYDIPRSISNDNILDLIQSDNAKKRDAEDTKQSSKSKRRAKNKRRQNRKRSLRNIDDADLESVDTKQEDSKTDDCVIQIESAENKDDVAVENPESSEKKSIFSRYINTETILKRFPVVSPEMIETVKESKEKIMATLNNKEKITQVRDVLKAKTIKLKGALLNSSET